MSKIFCFINSGKGSDWVVTNALAEDGEFLASHISSNDTWAKHDIGVHSDWKHDAYKAHYPDGYEVVWVDDPGHDPDLLAAYQLHLQKYKEIS